VNNRNSTQAEINSKLQSDNACCHSVQNVLFVSLLSKYLKVTVYKIILLPVVVYGCETWSLILREESRLRRV
jgi:hypothetical protein